MKRWILGFSGFLGRIIYLLYIAWICLSKQSGALVSSQSQFL